MENIWNVLLEKFVGMTKKVTLINIEHTILLQNGQLFMDKFLKSCPFYETFTYNLCVHIILFVNLHPIHDYESNKKYKQQVSMS